MRGQDQQQTPRVHDAPGVTADTVRELAEICDRESITLTDERIELDHEVTSGWGEDDTGLFVGSIVHDGAGRVLLLQNQWSDGWMGPGGAVEPGESLRAAIRREIREETGVEVDIERPLFVERQQFWHESEPAAELVGYFVQFEARATTTDVTADPGLDGETIHEVRWFDVAALPEETVQRDRIRSTVPGLTGE